MDGTRHVRGAEIEVDSLRRDDERKAKQKDCRATHERPPSLPAVAHQEQSNLNPVPFLCGYIFGNVSRRLRRLAINTSGLMVIDRCVEIPRAELIERLRVVAQALSSALQAGVDVLR